MNDVWKGAGILVYLLVFILSSCNTPDNSEAEAPRIFEKLNPKISGVTFENLLDEDSVVNYFTDPYIYMGGGVALGDINNDGLQDIYFTGNMVKNRLFLNKGDLKFEDISESAGVTSDSRWSTGAAMADVNGDGYLDIYLSVAGQWTTTENQLFINNGDLTFSEMAYQYGVADSGATTQATFFDYDRDGDLDLFNANYPPTSFQTLMSTYRYMMETVTLLKSDRLYRNNGDGTFTDVTEEAGVKSYGLTLSATVGDFDDNGWPDLYVSNDFASRDYFYFNNGDGTFTEHLKQVIKHTAFYGMGADVGDINNDGLLDIMQLDMTPEDHLRAKTNMGSITPEAFWSIVNYGFHYQYMANMLQLNNGIGPDGLPHFSDISQIAGVAYTDWSWGPLIADLDNDGNKDIFVSNGTRREINNRDFFKKVDGDFYFGGKKEVDLLKLTKQLPSEKIEKYAFRNNGDLTFSKVTRNWGLSFLGFTNGSAYADLDNDGDLEIVLNNLDTVAVVFNNLSVEKGYNHFLRIKLQGPERNPFGLDTKIRLKAGGSSQFQQLTMTRGFQSSSEPYVHFGLGKADSVDQIEIIWPDEKQQTIMNVPGDQILTIQYDQAPTPKSSLAKSNSFMFQDITDTLGIYFPHKETNYNDFINEPGLPHRTSRFGPALATADVNGDGLTDFFVGAAIDSVGMLFIQKPNGSFKPSGDMSWAFEDIKQEDVGAVFFDANSDNKPDLYIVSGGNTYDSGAVQYQDRLYVNDGLGHFRKVEGALPNIRESGSCAVPCDVDNDGDMDLFVGGRITPKTYPLPPRSFLLINESKNGKIHFVDRTAVLAPELLRPGMVTDATWLDYDNDNDPDLFLTGEWMPLTVFRNDDGQFENVTEELGLLKSTGWWFSLATADFDGDGDLDLVGGNLGLNYKLKIPPGHSFDLYAYDYDKNNKLDVVLAYYQNDIQYPVRDRNAASKQIPAIKIKFLDHESYARATLADIYSKIDLKKSLHYQAWEFATCYIENQGDGKFVFRKLPNEAQLSPVMGIVIDDFNNDGNLDMVTAGNLYVSNVNIPRADAGYGNYLTGDGHGNFTDVPFSSCGIFIPNDVRHLAYIDTPKGKVILVANNNYYFQAIGVNHSLNKKFP